jgi:hypothetical protein
MITLNAPEVFRWSVNFLTFYFSFLICLDGFSCQVYVEDCNFSVSCSDLHGHVMLLLALMFCPCVMEPLFFPSLLLSVILKFMFYVLAFVNLSCLLTLQLQRCFKIMRGNAVPLCSNTMLCKHMVGMKFEVLAFITILLDGGEQSNFSCVHYLRQKSSSVDSPGVPQD